MAVVMRCHKVSEFNMPDMAAMISDLSDWIDESLLKIPETGRSSAFLEIENEGTLFEIYYYTMEEE